MTERFYEENLMISGVLPAKRPAGGANVGIAFRPAR